MKLLKNRAFAVVLLIIVFVVAGLTSVRSSLNEMSREVEVLFTSGENNDGDSISKNLEERTKLSYELIGIAKKYLEADDEALVSLITARDILNDAKTIKEKSAANLTLTEAIIDLNSALSALDLEDKDAERREYLVLALDNENDSIRTDIYNQKVNEFNKKLSTFPVSFLSVIVGVQPLDSFS